ncbi:MAG: uncharacterized protein KVP18_000456 [Porospora cf. gigantea A]|uniref:uncharacterized protein n=1 Tax=Porospora cf. gigantea A TaxID=2853593 RepID=UPI00355A7B49|nr:MAG: hypothetical protein KVP18_000456 [Porospora cf. gigantea A]
MGESGLRIAKDCLTHAREGVEFPILCETCLGDNPYIRMMKCAADKECKTCARPTTMFRWQPGRKARYKQTVVCQQCARTKNVCQCCLFDLEYGLPVQVRDKYLQMTAANAAEVLPNPVLDRLYAQERGLPHRGSAQSELAKIARAQPYYERNLPKVCSFWLKSECTRDECPFRHEQDEHDPTLMDQRIRNRYFGKNDPVAEKMLSAQQDKDTRSTAHDKETA